MALVFIANIVPGILMKSSAPYWFDRVSYKARIRACALLMCGSYLLVGISSTLALQLLGVVLASTQSSMGEASLLALATRYPRPSNNSSEALVSKFDGNETHGKEKSDAGPTLTAWSSGTGFAGVFGFAWVALFDDVFGLPSRVGLFAALSFAVVWLILFSKLLPPPPAPATTPAAAPALVYANVLLDDHHRDAEENVEKNSSLEKGRDSSSSNESRRRSESVDNQTSPIAVTLSGTQRFRFFLSLWPYTVPLFVVYTAEYCLQSGVWSAIGFPVSSASARDNFYLRANWCYQGGVFLSRSSGTLFAPPSLGILWLLPSLQAALFGLFFWFALLGDKGDEGTLYDRGAFLVLCSVAGLFGGAVYVHGFKLISVTMDLERRELGMAAASVAADFGIGLASVASLFIQACIYRRRGIDDIDDDVSVGTAAFCHAAAGDDDGAGS